MKHILDFNDFLNEAKNYQNEEDLIADAFEAFNSKYGTKLSMKNFDFQYEGTQAYIGGPYKYYWSNNSAKKDIDKLKALPDWESLGSKFDRLEIIIRQEGNNGNYNIGFWKLEKRDGGKDTQALFTFPKLLKN
jgi:hypothetical protein